MLWVRSWYDNFITPCMSNERICGDSCPPFPAPSPSSAEHNGLRYSCASSNIHVLERERGREASRIFHPCKSMDMENALFVLLGRKGAPMASGQSRGEVLAGQLIGVMVCSLHCRPCSRGLGRTTWGEASSSLALDVILGIVSERRLEAVGLGGPARDPGGPPAWLQGRELCVSNRRK